MTNRTDAKSEQSTHETSDEKTGLFDQARDCARFLKGEELAQFERKIANAILDTLP